MFSRIYNLAAAGRPIHTDEDLLVMVAAFDALRIIFRRPAESIRVYCPKTHIYVIKAVLR
jgi:hypothetical protein